MIYKIPLIWNIKKGGKVKRTKCILRTQCNKFNILVNTIPSKNLISLLKLK